MNSEIPLVFSPNYAAVYDLINSKKPYADEVRFTLELVEQQLGVFPKTVFDVACGTGKHLVEFARNGVAVHGNDLSEAMIKQAATRLVNEKIDRVCLIHQPMEQLRPSDMPPDGFDLLVAYYTALGYLHKPRSLHEFLKNARNLIRPGGFLFADLWNGHKMAKQFSPYRKIQMENETMFVTRESSVSHRKAKNCLDVHFTFQVQEKKTNSTTSFDEQHTVRYFTVTEIENILLGYGLKLVSHGPFFDDAVASCDAWNFYFLAKRNT